MFAKKQKTEQLSDGLHQCLSGQEIFANNSLKKHIAEIKNLVSCPQEVYSSLYLSTLYRLAEFCQAMPFSENQFQFTYGLLHRQLTLAIGALKLRRGMLLPKDASAEIIALEEARWTFAIFSAALLQGLPCVQSDRTIILFNKAGYQVGQWMPIAGSLFEENLSYHLEFSKQTSFISAEDFIAVLIGKMISSTSMRWLINNNDLGKLWWDAIKGKPNEIMTIIEEAAKLLSIELFHQETIGSTVETDAEIVQEEQLEDKDTHLEQFKKWIQNQLIINDDLIFRTEKGLFVSTDLISKQFVPAYEINLESLTEKLISGEFLVPAHQGNEHIFVPVLFEDRRRLYGIILNGNFFPNLTHLEINTDFQENIMI
jgi:hypothetical protein